jgi:hypothetical protein
MTPSMPPGDPNDLRFQFEIIKQLAENGRTLASNIGEIQKTQVAMLERLARIESNAVNETVSKLEEKVDRLERMEDRRAGENDSRTAILKWWPVIAFALSGDLDRRAGTRVLPPP